MPHARRLVFDTETNDLLANLTTMHCLGAVDIDTGEEFYFGPAVPKDAKHPKTGAPLWTPVLGTPAGTVEDGVRFIEEASLLLGHNAIDFDLVAIEKLFPWFTRPAKAWDTLVAAKVVWPYDVLFGPDLARAKAGKLPMALVKRHSLKAWGYRLGDLKDEYDGGFSAWNPWMAAYMLQDCRVPVKLWRMIEERVGWTDKPADLKWPEAVFEVEHEVARIIKQQELDGVHFDRPKAQALAVELSNEQARLGQDLKDVFGSWWAAGKVVNPAIPRKVKRVDYPTVTLRRFSEKTGKELTPYVGPPFEEFHPDWPYTPITWTTFSPSSRDHLGQRLQAVYGWKPKKFGTNGKPTVDESTLEEIPEAVMPKAVRKTILDYFVVSKTLGMVANGKKSWLGLLTDADRIHGRMDTAGAVTGRGTHKDPNMSQVPSVKKRKVKQDDGSSKEIVLHGIDGRYGYECRSLVIADEGWEQTGVDASSLELIDLGHYLFPLDGGAFSERVCDPKRDAHQEHADIAGVTRADAKTTIYLRVYGGSAYKLSLDPAIVVEEDEVVKLLSYRGLTFLLSNLAKRFDQDFVDKLDDMQKARISKARQIIVKLDEGITGLKELSDNVKAAAERGWLKGMDGRKVYVRSPHAALNTLLQSAGAQTCKLWMVLLHRRLKAEGLLHGKDFKQVLFIHDELNFTHRPGLGPLIGRCAKETIREAGVILGLRGEYRGDAKHGFNWAETH